MLIATHCHSHYSFDCQVTITEVADACVLNGIGCTLITDHDVFELTKEDLKIFQDRNVIVLNAIEFTTKEGAHVIGIHKNIKELERSRYFYKAKELIKLLKENKAWISLPHPSHATGILKAGLANDDLEYCLLNSDFIEERSSKYGQFDVENIKLKFVNLKAIISDDAHQTKDIGLMLNNVQVGTNMIDKYETILNALHNESVFKYNKRRLFLKRAKSVIVNTWLYKNIGSSLNNKIKQLMK